MDERTAIQCRVDLHLAQDAPEGLRIHELGLWATKWAAELDDHLHNHFSPERPTDYKVKE